MEVCVCVCVWSVFVCVCVCVCVYVCVCVCVYVLECMKLFTIIITCFSEFSESTRATACVSWPEFIGPSRLIGLHHNNINPEYLTTTYNLSILNSSTVRRFTLAGHHPVGSDP